MYRASPVAKYEIRGDLRAGSQRSRDRVCQFGEVDRERARAIGPHRIKARFIDLKFQGIERRNTRGRRRRGIGQNQVDLRQSSLPIEMRHRDAFALHGDRIVWTDPQCAAYRERVIALQRAIRAAVVILNLRPSRSAESQQPDGTDQYSFPDSHFHGFSSDVINFYVPADAFGWFAVG